MFEGRKEHYKYTSSPYENRQGADFYLSAKEIQEKRGEDLARRLYNFRKSLKESAYKTSPISSTEESLEKAFLYEFTHLSETGRRKFASLIWEKNVEEELSEIWPEFSGAVRASLNNI
ncbi:MAG TPA: hypothetical protein H9673_08820 [Candidatus Adamsella sp.]|nr:hypothetical protein [Candidatus Adamsella sp.]